MNSKKNIVKKDDKVEKIKQEISKLPKEQKEMFIEQTKEMFIEQTIEYKGILPPPVMLKQFNEIIPNGADRIMKMAEIEAEERKIYNRKQLRYHSAGLYLAFILALFVFIGGFILAYSGNNTGSGILVGTVLTGVVIAFINGKKTK